MKSFVISRMWPGTTINAPINVKPLGGEAGQRRGI